MKRERDGASITYLFSDIIVYRPNHATYFGIYKSILRQKNITEKKLFKKTIIIKFNSVPTNTENKSNEYL